MSSGTGGEISAAPPDAGCSQRGREVREVGKTLGLRKLPPVGVNEQHTAIVSYEGPALGSIDQHMLMHSVNVELTLSR